VKYNYNLDVLVQNADHYFATLQVSKDGKEIIFNNLKPQEYKQIKEADIDGDSHYNDQKKKKEEEK
jgi:hypothetical protein|tara:strand:- start:69 stop:266 length:198 start_codon:yes stop_codon:yes gene_type:complete